ncbi:MAG: hypothetical protein Q4G07_08825 [Oscillospiraceae bacterium]|nr:hypothetical protein [Oscillospiraceae bacterium]
MKYGGAFFLFALLGFAFLFDSIGVIRCAVLAALLHEAGHLLAWRPVTGQSPRLSLSVGGLSLRFMPGYCGRLGETLILAAGPLANLLAAGAGFFLLSMQAKAAYYLFTGANLCMGAFNLMPFSFLDGGRLLRLWCLQYGERVLRATDTLAGCLLGGYGFYLMTTSRNPITKISVMLLCGYFFLKRTF